MELYEYLIGGKKTGQIEDLKDAMSDGKPFCELKKGELFFISLFKVDGGTRTYADEIKITSIDKKHTRWTFTGLTKEGAKDVHLVWWEDLNKTLYVEKQRTYYIVISTFEMDAEPLFELAKKEIENSKNK